MKICEQTLLHKLYGMIMINLPAKELVEKAFLFSSVFPSEMNTLSEIWTTPVFGQYLMANPTCCKSTKKSVWA